ncbi:MAG TPA: hypothetical protein VGY53_07965 [Isosphaeraceae bacterium]|nr:hypothetical protein [Isosphaeraceae bacterium]
MSRASTLRGDFRCAFAAALALGLAAGFALARPETPESLCRRLAGQLDLEIRARGLKRVGVLEFLEPLGKTDGLAPAHLPAYLAEQVRSALESLAGDRYLVLSAAQVQQASLSINPERLKDRGSLRALANPAQGADAVIVGTLSRREHSLHLSCELVTTADGASMANQSGVLPLTEDLLADLGLGFDNRSRPAGAPHATDVVSQALEQAHQASPLLKDDFPFRVEIWSAQPRRGEAVGPKTPWKAKEFIAPPPGEGNDDAGLAAARNSLLVAARPGEIFEIRVWNKSGNRAAMTLLIDGINTLGKKRERLGKAWSWVIEPTPASGQPQAIKGWTVPKGGGQFAVSPFQFTTDLGKSVAGRQKFNEAIGVVTTTFYAERGRALAVGEGAEEARELQTKDFQAGRLLGVVQIRYVDERELQ